VNELLLSVVLGIVEGVTEFLPVSSTAHLRIAQDLFRLPLSDPYWKMYAVVIQLGAVLCLPVYFWARIKKLVGTFPKGERGDRNVVTHPLSLVMLAFVCTAVPAVLMKKLIDTNLESLKVIGVSLLLGGAVMWAIDAIFGRREEAVDDDDESTDALAMLPAVSHSTDPKAMPSARAAKVVHGMESMTLAAVFPGTSRSMATIAAGQTAGLSRATALEFSFFLSMPTMAAACLKELKDTLSPSANDVANGAVAVHVTGSQWLTLGVGFVVSFLVAIVVVHWFMGWVRKRGFVPFAIYRIVLGLVVLLAVRSGHGAPATRPADPATSPSASMSAPAPEAYRPPAPLVWRASTRWRSTSTPRPSERSAAQPAAQSAAQSTATADGPASSLDSIAVTSYSHVDSDSTR
jgi:undecaprenyl-diphosphatase